MTHERNKQRDCVRVDARGRVLPASGEEEEEEEEEEERLYLHLETRKEEEFFNHFKNDRKRHAHTPSGAACNLGIDLQPGHRNLALHLATAYGFQ